MHSNDENVCRHAMSCASICNTSIILRNVFCAQVLSETSNLPGAVLLSSETTLTHAEISIKIISASIMKQMKNCKVK